MATQSKISRFLLLLAGAAVLAGLQYCTSREAYFEEQRLFVEGLTYEATVLLELNEKQQQHVMGINFVFCHAVDSLLQTGNSSKAKEIAFENELRNRNSRIQLILDERQKKIWRDAWKQERNEISWWWKGDEKD